MKQPEKWKDTVDPFLIKYNNFKLKEVLGYPHARNDVFYCKGINSNNEILCFLKYGSRPDSDINNEIIALKTLNFSFIPKIVDFADNYIITKEIIGERLSYILQTTSDNSIEYMFNYGKTLSKIHSANLEFSKMKHRKFFDLPTKQYLSENNIEFIYDYLIKKKPKQINQCFCHGDFHYANILWNDKNIVGVLDWELCGIGNREFDIAWSIINRPGQKFLKTNEEINLFLEGYQSYGECNIEYIKYYMVLIYSHFISVDKQNEEYKNFVINKLYEMVKYEDDNNR